MIKIDDKYVRILEKMFLGTVSCEVNIFASVKKIDENISIIFNCLIKIKGIQFERKNIIFFFFFEDDGGIRKSSVKRINRVIMINVKETRLNRFRAKFDNGP